MPDFKEIKKRFYQTIKTVGKHYSSMYQDVISKRKTELDFLNGLIIKLGKEKGIPTPMNKIIFDKIKKIIMSFGLW